MQRILVIGGNRFFGKRLISLLLSKGAEVTVLNRGQIEDGFGDRVKRIRLDRKLLVEQLSMLDGYFWDVVYDQVCFDAIEAKGACLAFRGKVGHYVFTSSQAVYGSGGNIQESAFSAHKHFFDTFMDRRQDYGEAKRQAEAIFAREAPFPVTAVRLSIVLGEDDYTERLKFHVDRVLEKRPIFFPNLEAKISFVRSADAAAFLAHLSQRKYEGPINCSSASPLILKALISEIERQTDRVAEIVNRASDGECSPFGRESDWFMNTDRLEKLGFKALPIDQWLPRLITYFLASSSTPSS